MTNERKREQGLGRGETLLTVLFFKVFENGAYGGTGIHSGMRGGQAKCAKSCATRERTHRCVSRRKVPVARDFRG